MYPIESGIGGEAGASGAGASSSGGAGGQGSLSGAGATLIPGHGGASEDKSSSGATDGPLAVDQSPNDPNDQAFTETAGQTGADPVQQEPLILSPDQCLNAIGTKALYRARWDSNEVGRAGADIHAGVVTKMQPDFAANLTCFPDGGLAHNGGLLYVTDAAYARVSDASELAPGEWMPNE